MSTYNGPKYDFAAETPKHIPPLVAKRVVTTGLKTKSLNNKFGLVKNWNQNRERFVVIFFKKNSRMIDSEKLIKPMNLQYAPNPENEKEDELFNMIFHVELTNFEKGLSLFEEIESMEENHGQVYMKVCWFELLACSVIKKDPRFIPEMENHVRNIIETSKFPDIIVNAKLVLCEILSGMPNKTDEMLELAMSCMKEHYGNLPRLVGVLLSCGDGNCSNRALDFRNENDFEILKRAYYKARTMVQNKLCATPSEIKFMSGGVGFLYAHGRKIENLNEEITIMKEICGEYLEHPTLGKQAAEISIMEGNHRAALEQIENYQHYFTSRYGNNAHNHLVNCYIYKFNCYVALGKKRMARKALKKLQTFVANDWKGLGKQIERMKIELSLMPDEINEHGKENRQKIRTKMQCSSYVCENVEPYVGAYLLCSRCKAKYYCSEECHIRHWKDGHKKECKKLKEKKKNFKKVKKSRKR